MAAKKVGATPLVKLDDIAPGFRDAASAAAAALRVAGEAPEEFFVEVEKTPEVLVLHLWHQDAFLPENAGVLGNPAGRCRDMHYDPQTGTITKTLFWQ